MKTARRNAAAKVWALVICCAVAAACTTRPGDAERKSEPAPPAAAPAASGSGTPLDLASVMRRAHFRFRPDGDGFVARQSAYEARVDPAGTLTVGPLVLTTLAPGARPRAARDGGVDITRDRCVTEHAVGTDAGIEQSWVHECAPADGDLVVRVAVKGATFAASDERGLVFRSDGRSIRYGAATWVDARGVRTAVKPEWADGTITLRVPEEVVRSSTFPATLDPLVGPELELDEPFVVRAASTQDHAAVAFNGTSYFVVWDDLRNGDWDIYGARVDAATGQVLSADANGAQISVAAGSQQLPAVTSNGTDFFVVWQDTRASAVPKIYGARVAGTTGKVVEADAGGFALGGGAASQRSPDVAWDGTNYFVVWEDGRTPNGDIFGVRVGTNGATLAADASGIAIHTAASKQLRPRVACDGTRCLVVWSDDRAATPTVTNYDIYGARVVSATGVVAGEPVAIAVGAASEANPSIAYDSVRANYLVAWDDFTSGSSPDIRGRRIAAATGAVVDATSIAIATGAQAQRGSSVAFDGTRFLVTWSDASPSTIYGALIGGDSARITPVGGVALGSATTLETGSAAAGGSAGFYVAWSALGTSAPSDIHGTRVDATTGAAREKPSVVLSGHANAELAPAVASNGTDYFVVWEDWRTSAPGDVYGVRVRADGTVPAADEAGVLIAVAAPPGSSGPLKHVQPAIAFGDGTYLVAWTDRRSPPAPDGSITTAVYALRVDPATGRPVAADGTGIRVSAVPTSRAEQTAPALAFTGGTFMAAWRDGRNGPDNVYARGVKVGASGLTLGTEVRIGLGPKTSTAPSIAGDGAQTFLIAWEDFRDGIQFGTYAARVDATGQVKGDDAGGFAVSQIVANQIGPSVAWSGSEFFVAWEDHRTHGVAGEIFGRRIPVAGAPIGNDIPIAAGIGAGTKGRESPVVVDARDGAPGGNLQVVWREDRGGRWDLYGSLVRPDGLVREPQGLGIALEPGDKGAPALAARGNAEMLVTYSRLDPLSPFAVARARARILSTGLRAGACTKDDDCATRFCTDGQCCDERCDAPCRACGTGTCSLVRSGQDDACSGISSCSADGQCHRANGQPCQEPSQCSSGVCDRDDGVCCDRPCDGECNTCKSNKAPGICTALIAGTAPVNCVPFACDGKSDQCPTACEGDIMCARPNVCLPGGKCEPLLASTCIDTKTIKAPSGIETSCSPYACIGAACVSPCKSVADCVDGFVCNADGKCVEPPRESADGCSCRTVGTPARGDLAWLAAALLALVRRARRRAPEQ